MESMEHYRAFLKSERWDEWQKLDTDQRKNIPHPPFEQPYPDDATLVALAEPDQLTLGRTPLVDVISRRRSRRAYTQEPFTLDEVSFLLWATQGVQNPRSGGSSLLRTVPSGGSRHPFETYLAVNRVDGLEPGLYRYLPLEHKLHFIRADADLGAKVARACNEQRFIARAALVFIWTTVPYRSEWRYSTIAHKVIAIDVGHVCQNLYLASESIGGGTCAIAAYNQREMDGLLEVDGKEEFTIYAAPVGKIP